MAFMLYTSWVKSVIWLAIGNQQQCDHCYRLQFVFALQLYVHHVLVADAAEPSPYRDEKPRRGVS